jgi:hypothetical protein
MDQAPLPKDLLTSGTVFNISLLRLVICQS